MKRILLAVSVLLGLAGILTGEVFLYYYVIVPDILPTPFEKECICNTTYIPYGECRFNECFEMCTVKEREMAPLKVKKLCNIAQDKCFPRVYETQCLTNKDYTVISLESLGSNIFLLIVVSFLILFLDVLLFSGSYILFVPGSPKDGMEIQLI